MEYIKRVFLFNFNTTCFAWCFCIPVFTFAAVLSAAVVSSGASTQAPNLDLHLKEFLTYYDRYFIREFSIIFVNNGLLALLIVYFTPLAMGIRKMWAFLRGRTEPLTTLEKSLLYFFPVIFLMRQAVNIAVIVNNLAEQINRSIIITFAGILLPHGLPELISFSVAGAIGMAVTRKILSGPTWPVTGSKPLVTGRVLSFLIGSVALCALLEVYFTPKVFALLISSF